MKKLNNNLKLIFIFVGLFFFGGLYVFGVEVKNHNYEFHKQWTAVYFLNPQKESLNFAIENYEGEVLDYHYLIYDQNGKEVLDKAATIRPGEREELKVENPTKGKGIIKYKDQEKALIRL